MQGKYGNGEFRKKVLGDTYNLVQNKVNESLVQIKDMNSMRKILKF